MEGADADDEGEFVTNEGLGFSAGRSGFSAGNGRTLTAIAIGIASVEIGHTGVAEQLVNTGNAIEDGKAGAAFAIGLIEELGGRFGIAANGIGTGVGDGLQGAGLARGDGLGGEGKRQEGEAGRESEETDGTLLMHAELLLNGRVGGWFGVGRSGGFRRGVLGDDRLGGGGATGGARGRGGRFGGGGWFGEVFEFELGFDGGDVFGREGEAASEFLEFDFVLGVFGLVGPDHVGERLAVEIEVHLGDAEVGDFLMDDAMGGEFGEFVGGGAELAELELLLGGRLGSGGAEAGASDGTEVGFVGGIGAFRIEFGEKGGFGFAFGGIGLFLGFGVGEFAFGAHLLGGGVFLGAGEAGFGEGEAGFSDAEVFFTGIFGGGLVVEFHGLDELGFGVIGISGSLVGGKSEGFVANGDVVETIGLVLFELDGLIGGEGAAPIAGDGEGVPGRSSSSTARRATAGVMVLV